LADLYLARKIIHLVKQHRMKRFLTLVVLVFSISALSAQLPNGATVPNFTAKDISGRVWDLYEILESGRPVVIDVSATWCGPCWSYHNSGQLENYFAAHGPEGDGKSFVFFIEGDGATNLACLYGPAGCNGGTQGNWVAGTGFPIIDNAAIANSFETNYFPTGMLVCPDKTNTQVDQQSATALWTKASACVGTIPNNYSKLNTLDPGTLGTEICAAQTATPTVNLSNLGGLKVSKLVMELRWNGQVIQTKTFEPNTGVLHVDKLTFDAVQIPTAGTLSASIVSVNDGANSVESTVSAEILPAQEKLTQQQIILNIRTDANGKDTYWVAYDDAGNEIANGGNVKVGANGGGAFPAGSPTDPSAYGNSVLIRDTFEIPANSCFTLKVVDGAGDGIAPPGLIRLFELGNTTPFFTKIGNWTANEKHTFAPKTSGTLEPKEISSFEIFPNPAVDQLTVTYTLDAASDCNLSVSNATGQLVRTQTAIPQAIGKNQYNLSLASLSNGIYFLHMQTNTGMKTLRFVVAK